MPPSSSFGSWLKQRRQALDLTRADLAQRVGCSAVLIQKIETNERRPSKQIAARLAELLGIPPAERSAFVQFARACDPTAASAEPPPAARRPLFQAMPETWSTDQPLIGREQEAALLQQLLRADTRLITLVGPPGIGKTRLALDVAAELGRAFRDGVWVVPLAEVAHAGLVATTIAQIVGIEEARAVESPGAVADVLADALSDKQMLLVLDNFEHLLAAAPVVATLVAHCPAVQVLVTSRAPLNLPHERTLALAPLALPEPGRPATVEALARCSAVALFVARARAAKPDFQLSEANASAVAAICARLDGIPLALELAAARSNLLPPAALLARLTGAQGYSLLRLPSPASTAPRHQRTLRDTLAWSYNLLSPPEQTLFLRLGIFSGGCTFAAAEAICADPSQDAAATSGRRSLSAIDVLDGISGLVDNHLLHLVNAGDDEPRCVMLETVLAYAREQLAAAGELVELGRRHATWFVTLAETAAQQLTGPQQKHWLDRLERDLGNLRAVFGWLIEQHDLELAGRLVNALLRFWYLRGYINEGRRWAEQVLALLQTEADELQSQRSRQALRAAVLYTAGSLAHDQTDYRAAVPYYERSIALFQSIGNTRDLIWSMSNLAMLLYEQAAVDRSEQLFEQALALARSVNDTHAISVTLNNLGVIAAARGDLAQTERLYREVLELDRETGNIDAIAGSLHNLASVAYDRGDFATARAYFEESVALRRDIGSATGMASSLHGLGQALLKQRCFHLARQAFAESLQLRHDASDKRGIATCLEALAELAVASWPHAAGGVYAARLLGSTAAVRAATGAVVEPSLRGENEQTVTSARELLGALRFEAAWMAGRALSLEQAISYALDPRINEEL